MTTPNVLGTLGNLTAAPSGEMPESTVSKTYDLLAEGLAYSPDIKENRRFQEIIKEIKSII